LKKQERAGANTIFLKVVFNSKFFVLLFTGVQKGGRAVAWVLCVKMKPTFFKIILFCGSRCIPGNHKTHVENIT
jgi:hypothetical protein